MAKVRSYEDGCAIAQALDVVGERWALLVVRELLLGPKRFVDLRAALPKASPTLLSRRLRELEGAGVLRRGKLPPPARSRIYELTEWGRELEDAVLALGRWGSRSPSGSIAAPIGVDSIVLGLKCHFDPGAAVGLNAKFELRLADERFRIEVVDGALDVARGESDLPDAKIATDPETLRAVLWHGRPVAEARRAGQLDVDGREAALKRFVRLFPRRTADPVAAASPVRHP